MGRNRQLPLRATVFRERSSRKTVSYEEQIFSKDKYPSIFSPQMETIVFIILQIFFPTHAVLKTGEYLNNRVFLSRNYRLIVAPRKFDVLKTNICPRSEALRANMLVLRTSNF